MQKHFTVVYFDQHLISTFLAQKCKKEEKTRKLWQNLANNVYAPKRWLRVLFPENKLSEGFSGTKG